MRSRTFVYIACAPHARVGTSTTARLLAAYFTARSRPFSGFDTNPHGGAFARDAPSIETVDLGSTRGKIRLFDTLVVPDDVPKVVDLWHPVYQPFFTIAEDVGFLEEARRVQIEPVLLFHVDRSKASVQACRDLAAHWQGIEIVLVHNEAAAPFEAAEPGHLGRFQADHGILVRKLESRAAALLEDPDLSLSHFGNPSAVAQEGTSERAVASWVSRVFAQFGTFELRHALDDAEFL